MKIKIDINRQRDIYEPKRTSHLEERVCFTYLSCGAVHDIDIYINNELH